MGDHQTLPKFNMLTPLHFIERGRDHLQIWLFQCDCGEKKIAYYVEVRRGKTKSCGCLGRKIQSEFASRSRSKVVSLFSKKNPTFKNIRWAWEQMRQRCSNKNHTSYEHYGQRGIKVCERWESFENFYEDMGPRPSQKHSIDRIDVNGNYEPSNCRWATLEEQALNKRRGRLFLEGKRITAKQIAALTGFSASKVNILSRKGLSAQEIINLGGK